MLESRSNRRVLSIQKSDVFCQEQEQEQLDEGRDEVDVVVQDEVVHEEVELVESGADGSELVELELVVE